MDRIDLLKQAKAKVDALVAEKEKAQELAEEEAEAVKLAIEMQKHDSLVEAVQSSRLNEETLANIFKNTVSDIKVSVPEVKVPEVKVNVPEMKIPDIKIPEIKIPKITVPKPEVTVNVPEFKIPKIEVPEVTVNVPDVMDVGLDRYTKMTPLHVMPVDAAGKLLAPSSGGGGGGHVKATIQPGAKVGVQATDSPSIDAFGRWRTSEPSTIFDSKQIFDNAPLLFDDQEVSGGGTSSTHNAAHAATVIAVSDSTAGKRVRQSFMRMNYQPGKSQMILCTGTLGAGGTGITAAMGYFDDDNGLFAMSKNGAAYFVKRTSYTGSAVDTEVAQADWNIDTFDGNGPSGIALDPTKSQILFIDFEWLGVGRVRMGWVVDGKIYYCHEFLHSNNQAGVYMSTPNLPIRYEIENDGTGGAATLEHICCSVQSEGGVQNNGYLRHYDTGAVTSLAANTAYAVMGGKLKDTHLGATVLVENISVIGSANDQCHWELRVGGAVTTTVASLFTYNEVPTSAVKVAIGDANNVVTGGTEIDGGYFTTTQAVSFTVPNALHLGAAIDGTPQEWQLVMIPITNNMTVRASVTWRELL